MNNIYSIEGAIKGRGRHMPLTTVASRFRFHKINQKNKKTAGGPLMGSQSPKLKPMVSLTLIFAVKI